MDNIFSLPIQGIPLQEALGNANMKTHSFILVAPVISEAKAVETALQATFQDPVKIQAIYSNLNEATLLRQPFRKERFVINLDDSASIRFCCKQGVDCIYYLLEKNGNSEPKVRLFRMLTPISGEEAIPRINHTPGKLLLSTNDEYHLVTISDILYCRAEDNYTYFHIRNKPVICTSKPLREYETQLAEHAFFRVHKSYLINTSEVDRIVRKNGDFAIMSNADRIPLSIRKKQAFIQHIKAAL